MLQLIAPLRQPDQYGAGYFGAPRGTRKHRGADYAAAPGSSVLADVNGFVSKLGYPYADDLTYRYVEVTTPTNYRIRYFYVEPGVSEGQAVHQRTVLGTVQSLDKRYPGITEHVHIEVYDPQGNAVDPERSGPGVLA